MNFENRPTHSLRPYAGNARTHSPKQIKQISRSIERFGFNNPVLVDDDDQIIAGHGRVEAAKLLNMKTVPTVRLSHLSEAEKRAYILADNRLAEKAGWDNDTLAIELQGLVDIGFDVLLTGFEPAEVDIIIEGIGDESEQPENLVPEQSSGPPVSRLGDVWMLGKHLLVCGDSTDAATYKFLMGDDKAEFVFTDPPYNVRIDGNVSGLGRVKHREFAMASGEMSEGQFTTFLSSAYALLCRYSTDGSIHQICMDWRHIREMLAAGDAHYAELKNVCIWNKTNGGMGTFYRSKHEMVTEITRRHYRREGLRYGSDTTDAEWFVMEPLLPPASALGRPRATNMRTVIDAILYIASTGCQWRQLPKDFPPYSTVQGYFYAWSRGGIFATLNYTLVMASREAAGREASPTAGVIDSQSVKTTESGGPRGYDAGKKIKGRKRHIVTDTEGNLVGLVVHEANIQDRDGAPCVLAAIRSRYPWLRHIFADGGYAGEKLRTALKRIGEWTIEIIKRSDTAQGFEVLPRRWVVERTFAWLGRCRRLAKDFEATIASAVAWALVAHIRTLTRRLARA